MRPTLEQKMTDLRALFETGLAEESASFSADFLLEPASYSLQLPGKRIRPVLALLVGESLGIAPERLLSFALAIEVVHTATLIHDDMPCMDDDDLRRGQPTCHIKFGEARALLAGDALISRAFSLISEDSNLPERARLHLVSLLSRTLVDVCKGQVMDIASNNTASVEQYPLEKRHLLKTAALIEFSVIGPTFLSSEHDSPTVRDVLSNYAKQLGLLFQITDDLLDVTASASQLGKTPQSDTRKGLETYVSLYGEEGAREKAREAALASKASVASFPGETRYLLDFVDLVEKRAF